MNFFRVPSWIIVGFGCVVLGVPAPPPVIAQGGPPRRNLGATHAVVEGDWLAYLQWESFRGADLNGDGDTEDSVIHVQSLSAGETTNLGLAVEEFYIADDPLRYACLELSGVWLLFPVSERRQGEDLNGDGDTVDLVVHKYNLATRKITNLRLAVFAIRPKLRRVDCPQLSGDWAALAVSERAQGEDLNGDGDTDDDSVVHVHNLATGETRNLRLSGRLLYSSHLAGDWLVLGAWEDGGDLNGDGDTGDQVVHVHNLTTGETTNLRLAGTLLYASNLVGNWFVFSVSEPGQREDLNGDGDTTDSIIHVRDLAAGETRNLRLANVDHVFAVLSVDWLAFGVSEHSQGEDLDGDRNAVNEVIHVHDLAANETTNLGVAASIHDNSISGDWLALFVREGSHREDFNGDGDTEDLVAHVHNLLRNETTNLSLAASQSAPLSGNWFVFLVHELFQGSDLNGDGDVRDRVVHVRNLIRGNTTSLGLAVNYSRLSGDWLALSVSERDQGEDLNRDGDTLDDVLEVHNLATGKATNLRMAGDIERLFDDWLVFSTRERFQGEDLNGDGDTEDAIVHVYDLAGGQTTNLGVSGGGGPLSGDSLVLFVSERGEGLDLNGDGDTEDAVAHLVDLRRLDGLGRDFVRGDTNVDGDRNVTDAVFVLAHLFGGGDVPSCARAADANDSGAIDIADPVFLLNALFAGGAAIPAPFPDCGPDTTPDELSCESFAACE